MTTTLSAGVYQWRDANGNVVFGDSPPESAAVREVELPTLTVADSYLKDKKKKKERAQGAVAEDKPAEQKQEESTPQPVAVSYERFAVKSPQKNKSVRSNNGNILVKFELEPALQPGHGIVVYLDGKQVASGTATVYSLQSVDRGQHSLFAVLHNENNDVLINTDAVQFTLLRASKKR